MRALVLYGLVMVAVVIIGGCAAPLPDMAQKLRGIHAPGYFTREALQTRFPEEWRYLPENDVGDHVPQLGLALAGGGTKAADFSIGVLQGLEETGLLSHVGVISSVSGGGYAAYWYFARLNERSIKGAEKARIHLPHEFRDCMSSKYTDADPQQALTPCPAPNGAPHNYTNFEPGRDVPNGFDAYRYQNYLRGYQNVFSSGKGPDGEYPFRYVGANDDNPRFKRDVLEVGFGSLVLSVVNLLPNVLFDWETQLSISRHYYDSGIYRTFGARPPKCDLADSRTCGDDGQAWRAEGQLPEVDDRLDFVRLQKMIEDKQAPLWVINATAGEDRTPWDFAGPRSPELTVFEFTPYRSGSGIYGYRRGALGDVWLFRAVSASAAFLDSQQKVTMSAGERFFAAGAMRLTTFDWGMSYINPAIGTGTGGDQVDKSWNEPLDQNAQSLVAAHRMLPWPFYYLHYFRAAPDSAYIHLSDGGQSENLGAYSLIRRGVDTLIISDHAHDRSGTMEDICRLRRELKDQGRNVDGQSTGRPRMAYELYIPGLKNLARVCESANGLGYDIFDWNHRILVGCIVPDDRPHTDEQGRPLSDENYGARVCATLQGTWHSNNRLQQAADGKYWARVIVIKPAFGGPKLMHALDMVMKYCNPQNQEDCWEAVADNCGENHGTRLGGDDEPVPCEVLGFAVENFFVPGGRDSSDGCPVFPQFSTFSMTLESSPWMYGAMRELARYYTRVAASMFVSGTGKINATSFNEKLKEQVAAPLEPKPAERSVFFPKKAGINDEQPMCSKFPIKGLPVTTSEANISAP